MNRIVVTGAAALPFIVAAACSESSTTEMPSPDGGLTAVMQGGVAVVNSDFKNSTSVSLFDPLTMQVTFDDCINSGSTAAGLSQGLSGDVVLPSSAQPGHELLLIDRMNAALTYLDPVTCAVKRQFSVGTGFASNPYDVVALSETKAYVTRYEPNPTPTADPGDFDEGDDILIVNPADGSVSGRIDFASFAGKVGDTTVVARPGAALLVDGEVYVALDNISADFMTTAEGRILIVDPATDTVSGMVDLPGWKGCSGLSALAGEKTLIVTCQGDFNDPMQIGGSGIAAVDLAASPPVVTKLMGATAFGAPPQPLSAESRGAVSATAGLAVTLGAATPPPPDRLWWYDATAGTATQVMEAGAAFVYGALLGDPDRHQVFLADGTSSKPLIFVIDVSGAAPAIKGSFAPDPKNGLPPRALGWY